MQQNGKGSISLRLAAKSLAVWTVTALLTLVLASWILSKMTVGSEVLGYVSSALSFLCAAAAGSVAAKQGDRPWLQELITALVLLILLLTTGFLVRGRDLNSSGVLSVVSFTITGLLFGGLLSGRKKQPGKSMRFRKKNKGRKRFT